MAPTRPAAASLSIPSGGDGVDIDFGATANTVGGTSASARNILSGNGRSGVRIAASGTNNNVVQGNYIGTDVTGTQRLGNVFHGVLIHRGAQNNLIGGAAQGAGNLVSANLIEGITLSDVTTSDNTIQGNRIGTDFSGTKDLGNGADGVAISFSAPNNTVGGTASGAGNIIAFNTLNGVDILGGAENAILSNEMFANHLLGIDLGGDGVTPNSADPHTGSNNLQSFPTLTAAVGQGSKNEITGVLNSTPNTTFRFEFFTVPAADPSGYGQGQTLLGDATFTTDGNGLASFDATFAAPAVAGSYVTATATDSAGNTSEFAQDVPQTVVAAADLGVSIVRVHTEPGPCWRELLVYGDRYQFRSASCGQCGRGQWPRRR